MTLARTALRLATVQSLKDATIAQGRVYDSRVDDFQPENFPRDALPSIIVLTDEDEGDAQSDQNGGPPFDRMISLVCEFAIVQMFEAKYEEDGVTRTGIFAQHPATDGEHEAALDLLEYQIKMTLAEKLDGMPVLWRRLARVWKSDCHRQVTNDAGVKVAARVLTWQCQVDDDRAKFINPNTDDIPTGLDLLPEPLKTIAKALPAGSLLDTCNAIAAQLAPRQLVPLDGVDMRVTQGMDEDPATMLDVSIEIASAQDTPQIVVTGGTVTIDYAKGTFQNLILAANVSDISVINWPKNAKTGRLILKVTQIASYSIAATAWPDGTLWVGGEPPSITQGAGSIDLLVLASGSAGAEIFGNVIGSDYQPA